MQRSAGVYLSLALAVLAASLAPSLSASPVWFGDKDGLHRIDAATNVVTMSVPFEPPVAIAVNGADGSLWALTRTRLARLDHAGVLRFELALRDLGTGSGAPRLLQLNPNDGSVWAGFENRLLHIDTTGVVRHALSLRAEAIAIAQDGSVWVLGQSSLQRFDAAGVSTLRVSANAKMKYLELDEPGSAIWLAGEKDVVKLNLASPDQVLLSFTLPETTAGISVDVQSGDLWAIGQNSLFAYNRTGTPRLAYDLREISIANPQTLVFDFASQAAWVGHQQGLTRLSTAGALVAAFKASVQVGTVAIGRTPVDITPVVTLLAPADGSLINNNRPSFRVDYDALCGASPCGFPNSFFASFTLSARLNGIEVGSSFVFDPAAGGASFIPASPLPEGLNTITVQARDSFGGVSDPDSASFTVDTIAPVFINVAPPNGSTVTTASILIQGSVDDPSASVTLGTQSQGQSFSFPVTLAAGPNSFMLVARDPAGNATTRMLSYTYEPPNVPPAVRITEPANGANFTAPATVVVRADASDPDGSIVRVEFLRDGLPAGTDSTFPYEATLANLGLGNYVLTARAVDNRNGATVSDPVNISVGPPNALPAITLLSPTTNTQFSAPASVPVSATASDSDGTVTKVEFFRNGFLAATVTTGTPAYTATLAGVPAGTHTITARATDNRGGTATSAAVTITVAATTLTITSPAANASVTGNLVLVTGRFVGLANSGVTVNDETAAVDAFNNFFVNVPVTAGANTLTARLTTTDGTILTQSVNITANGVSSPYAAIATPAVGLAPLAVTFTVTNMTAGNVTFTIDGQGPYALPASAKANFGINYPAGVFVTTIVFTNTAAQSFTHRLIVDSRDPARLDQMFRAIWNGLNNSLVAGDKFGAMRYLNTPAREKYGPAFDELMPFMPQIVASYSQLARSSISAQIGEYAVSRMDNGQRRLYLIYFVLDADGVWRIDEM